MKRRNHLTAQYALVGAKLHAVSSASILNSEVHSVPTVYAINAELPLLTAGTAIDVFALALREWIGDRWPSGRDWFASEVPGAVTHELGRFRWEPFTSESRFIVDFVWTHRDQERPEITWRTNATLYSAASSKLQLNLEVANDGPESGEPGARLTQRSRLPLVLATLTDVCIGSTRVGAPARSIGAEGVPDFVRYDLFDTSRVQPVVVASPTEAGDFAVDPTRLVDTLATTAEVVVLETPEAAWQLTRSIGTKRLSCFHGGLRVYMPGLKRDSDPFAHPLLLASRAALPAVRARLACALALRTADTHSAPAEIEAARDMRAIAYANRISERIKDGNDVLAELAERESQLVEEARSYRERNRRLLSENRVLRRRVRELESGGQLKISESHVFPPETVLEAVETASELYGGALEFLPSAFSAAEESPYRKPEEVQKLLFSMGDIATSAVNGALGQDLYSRFGACGFTYKSGVGEATSKRLMAQYEATFDGEAFLCTEHVRLGQTYDAVDCLVVYFASDLKRGRFIVKSVGKHFTNMTTT